MMTSFDLEGRFVFINPVKPTTFYWSCYTKQEKNAVMYLYVRGIHFFLFLWFFYWILEHMLYFHKLSPLTLWVRISLRRGVLDTMLCFIVSQSPTTGRWFSPDTPVSSTNKTDRHDIRNWSTIPPPIIYLMFMQ
jgi:hypothetical protein